jgi:hypothetical protein
MTLEPANEGSEVRFEEVFTAPFGYDEEGTSFRWEFSPVIDVWLLSSRSLPLAVVREYHKYDPQPGPEGKIRMNPQGEIRLVLATISPTKEERDLTIVNPQGGPEPGGPTDARIDHKTGLIHVLFDAIDPKDQVHEWGVGTIEGDRVVIPYRSRRKSSLRIDDFDVEDGVVAVSMTAFKDEKKDGLLSVTHRMMVRKGWEPWSEELVP